MHACLRLQSALAKPATVGVAAVHERAASSLVGQGAESFLSGTTAVYTEEMYRLWKTNPAGVHASWDAYFKLVESGAAPGAAFAVPPGLQTAFPTTAAPTAASTAAATPAAVAAMVREHVAITHLIRAYQVRGHEVSVLDPLKLRNRPLSSVPELDYRNYGFSEADLERTFDMTGIEGLKGFLGT